MRLPRSISGKELVKALQRVDYTVTRQTGSHIRMTSSKPAKHHITIPNHESIRVGTLSVIVSEVAVHLKISKDKLLSRLFG